MGKSLHQTIQRREIQFLSTNSCVSYNDIIDWSKAWCSFSLSTINRYRHAFNPEIHRLGRGASHACLTHLGPIHIDCRSHARRHCRSHKLPFLCRHGRPHGPPQRRVWKRPSRPAREHTCRCIQQSLQQLLERFWNQPRVFAGLPRFGRRHVRHNRPDRSSLHLWHRWCCRSFGGGRRYATRDALLLDAWCHRP